MVQSADILIPLRLRSGAGDRSRNDLIVEHPIERELAARHAMLLGVLLNDAGKMKRFGPPFRLQNSGILSRDTRMLRQRFLAAIFSGQDSPGQGTIGDYTQPII